ncbi:MAG: ACT domain-containing protein [Erysipelotrichaceae bacterium]|nr:ACT domain-containing protein [Erysipelotrichaceae bacterium]
MEIKCFEGIFAVCKIHDFSEIPYDEKFCFIGKTDEELSLVCLQEHVPDSLIACEKGWRLLKLQGILDFDMVGVLAGITKVLADANISLFAVSTFNTDYILVKEEWFDKALKALEEAGHTLV